MTYYLHLLGNEKNKALLYIGPKPWEMWGPDTLVLSSPLLPFTQTKAAKYHRQPKSRGMCVHEREKIFQKQYKVLIFTRARIESGYGVTYRRIMT